jgi:hypothetical protein
MKLQCHQIYKIGETYNKGLEGFVHWRLLNMKKTLKNVNGEIGIY